MEKHFLKLKSTFLPEGDNLFVLVMVSTEGQYAIEIRTGKEYTLIRKTTDILSCTAYLKKNSMYEPCAAKDFIDIYKVNVAADSLLCGLL